MKKAILLSSLFISLISLQAQDTFSIVAVDSVTGEVGSAGASCVDLYTVSVPSDHFLGELFPGVGAINTQAAYHPTNQANARNRMNAGDSPTQIVQWLINNDFNSQAQTRQYGIVRLDNGTPSSAGFTGTSCYDYKNHVTGANYSIQGNILLNQAILDSMEAGFLNTQGDLACKLMGALQGANVVGADSRCATNGTSSLFAFVKVAQPGDTFGNPSTVYSVRTHDGDGIEPIDSLQTIFDNNYSCISVGKNEVSGSDNLTVFPNPAQNNLTVSFTGIFSIELIDITGKVIFKKTNCNSQQNINTAGYNNGIYFLNITSKDQRKFYQKTIISH